MPHFITVCSKTTDIRDKYYAIYRAIVVKTYSQSVWSLVSNDTTMMLSLIIDPMNSKLVLLERDYNQLEKTSRSLLYALHSRRSAVVAEQQQSTTPSRVLNQSEGKSRQVTSKIKTAFGRLHQLVLLMHLRVCLYVIKVQYNSLY